MMMVRALRVLCLLLSLTAGQAAADAPAKKYELVTDHLPSVEELLQTLEMESLLDTFYNSGFTETFYVLRMKETDLRMYAREWEMSDDQLEKLRAAIKELTVEREVIEVVEDPLVTARKELRYGKVVVERSTASFEYLRAHFSNKSLPIGSLPIRLASPTDACTIGDSEEIASTVAITLRGNCSFVDKAGNLSAAQVAGIIVVNNSSEMFQMAAGYATGAAGAAGTGNGQLEEDTSHIPTHLPVVSRRARHN